MAICSGELGSLAPWNGIDPRVSERSVKSAERTLALFELFSLHQSPLTIGQISNFLNIPQPSVTMLARNLVRLGYLEHNRVERTYLPTVRIMLLGSWVHRRFQLQNDIESRLDNLVSACKETVIVGLQNSLYCQYVCAVLPDRPDRLEIQSGMLRPLTRTAIGQVLLSQKSDAEVSLFVRRCNAEFPEHLRVNLADFMQLIQQIRTQGFAETSGNMTAGQSVIAMAIPAPIGMIPMAVGVGGEIGRVAEKRELILNALRELQVELRPAAMDDALAA